MSCAGQAAGCFPGRGQCEFRHRLFRERADAGGGDPAPPARPGSWRHRLAWPPQGQCQHVGPAARGDRRVGAQGLRAGPLRRRGPGLRPCRRRPAGEEHSGLKPASPLGHRPGRRHRARHHLRGGGAGSRSPGHQLGGRVGQHERGPPGVWQQPRLPRRLPGVGPQHFLLRRGRRGRRHGDGLRIRRGPRRGRPAVARRDWPRKRGAGRWPAWAAPSWRRAPLPCCFPRGLPAA